MLVKKTTYTWPYSIDHLDPENPGFTVTVVPINNVGKGQPSTFKFPVLSGSGKFASYIIV